MEDMSTAGRLGLFPLALPDKREIPRNRNSASGCGVGWQSGICPGPNMDGLRRSGKAMMAVDFQNSIVLLVVGLVITVRYRFVLLLVSNW